MHASLFPGRLVAFLAIALFALLWACTPGGESTVNADFDHKELFMDTAKPIIAAPTTQPPMDAAAVAELETATFGLG